jgi:lambda family phage minor tail protein L
MAYAAWTASTAYIVGDIVRAVSDNDSGFYFRCTIAGTSGANEPFWPTVIANTVQDGTVTWMAVSIVAGDLQTPNPSAIIELFELELVTAIHGNNDKYYFHAGTNATNNGDIVWNGQAYLRFPIEAEGFEYNGQGQLPRPTIRISNLQGTITTLLLTLPAGLEGAKVVRVRTLAKYLDAVNFSSGNPTADPTAEFPREIYYIDRKVAENRDVVEFELVSSMDLAGVRAPKRQCIGNICQWQYRWPECSYTGTNYFDANDQPVGSVLQDVCGKRLSSCKARFGANNQLPFGSFPGIGSSYG